MSSCNEIRAERDLLREDLIHMEGLAEQYLDDANKLCTERDALRAEVERLTREAEARAEAAERKLAMAVEALRFYENPESFSLNQNGPNDPIPDFYDELDFGSRARSTLATLEKNDE